MKGIYILLISVDKDISVEIGALGRRNFRRGLYIYVGSAQNNIEKRVKRHFAKTKRKYWHIDYLLGDSHAEVVKAFYMEAGKPDECRVAQRLGETAKPIIGFGSSDCKCKGHLFKLVVHDDLNRLTHETNLKPLGETMSTMKKTGWCVWITGLLGSGKSTISAALRRLLKKEGIQARILSSDALRKVLTPKPSYTLEERDRVYATLIYVAELLTQNGVNVIIDATGNLRRYRQRARTRIPTFIEAYLKCPLELCKEREAGRAGTHGAPRHIYERAEKGEAPTVPGMGQSYESPSHPEITLDTAKCSPMECAQKVLKEIFPREAGWKRGV